ncbi:hypothetical protein Tco_0267226 [Tanacetum coccineum]
MTRSSNTKVFTPFANLERQFQSKKDTAPIAVHNIYSFYESESLESESKDLSDIDIETLTLEQYLALNRLTAIEALESIQEKVDHSHRWYMEESDKKTSDNSFTNQKDNTPVMNSTSVQQECIMKLEPPQEIPKLETFSEKVKKRIMETQANEEKLLKKLECEPVNTTLVNDIQKTPEYTRHLQELVSNKIQIE